MRSLSLCWPGALVALCALWACKPDYKVQHVDSEDDGVQDAPNIVVTPDTLSYGTMPIGEAATMAFHIANDGDADLQISGMDIYGSGAYTLTTDASTFVLAPGEGRDIDVLYTAVGAEDSAQIHIYNDDPGNPEPVVFAEGGAEVPELLITPNPLSFGKVLVGCRREQSITLQNIGEEVLAIENLVQIGAGWELEVPFDLPTSLDPGASTEVMLTVTATEGDMDSQVWVTANDAVGTHVANQTGTGVTDPSVEEEFWQGDGPYDMADILFFVDQSCSMRDDQNIIMDNFESFASQLDEFELEWQVGVVTRDSGCFRNGILTPETPDVVATFVDAVDGFGGTMTEAGLSLTELALQRSTEGDCNEGFLREGSKVTLIEVSDETEQSPNAWNTYVSSIQAMAPTASITAIVGDVPNGCGRAEPGSGYYEASVATGGAFLSICASDWTSYFQTIAIMTASGLLDTFRLSSVPQPETLRVQVDGSTTTDWTYDEASNSIVFNTDAIPESGSHIVVYFELFGDCEG